MTDDQRLDTILTMWPVPGIYTSGVESAEDDHEFIVALCRDGLRWRHAVEDMGADGRVTSDVNVDDNPEAADAD